ncbi:hypothetical protein, partial [Thioalkalivibrio sp. ALE19]|uniref:autotransporter outer membrane beta-barrel domain-containing protein n=1 Tax=Thioalkalivibrio sp. ALE19 TaxID=1266909 RepID=UPI0006868922
MTAVLFCSLAIIAAGEVRAFDPDPADVDREWDIDTAEDLYWSNEENWDPQGVPDDETVGVPMGSSPYDSVNYERLKIHNDNHFDLEDLLVGYGDAGHLAATQIELKDNARLDTTNAVIGLGVDSNENDQPNTRMYVTDDARWTNTDTVYVGHQNHGRTILGVKDSGEFISEGDMIIGHENLYPTGAFVENEGRLEVRGDLKIGDNGQPADLSIQSEESSLLTEGSTRIGIGSSDGRDRLSLHGEWDAHGSIEIGVDGGNGQLTLTRWARLRMDDATDRTVHLAPDSDATGRMTIFHRVERPVADVDEIRGGDGEAILEVGTDDDDLTYHLTRNGEDSGAALKLTGSLSLTTNRDGTVVLHGHQDYTGGTEVDGNTLRLGDGAHLAPDPDGDDYGGTEVHDDGHLLLDGGAISYDDGSGTTVAHGQLEVAGDQGRLEHPDADLTLGTEGRGELLVRDDAHLHTDEATLGASADGMGTARLTDGGTWEIDRGLQVGAEGVGELVLDSDAELAGSASGFIIAEDPGSQGHVEISGPAATLDLEDAATDVGTDGHGSLVIRDGGSMHTWDGWIAASQDSTGEVHIHGDDSEWRSGAFRVGVRGTGTVTVAAGGRLEVDGAGDIEVAGNDGSEGHLRIGADNGAAGYLGTEAVQGGDGDAHLRFEHGEDGYHFSDTGTSDGEAIDITGSTSLHQDGTGRTILGPNGTYDHTGETRVRAGILQVDGEVTDSHVYVEGGLLAGVGTVGDVTMQGGTLSPGNSIGTLTTGSIDYSEGGEYRVQFNADGESDRLVVDGTARLSGGTVTLESLSAEAEFDDGQYEYRILEAEQREGEFDTMESPDFAFLEPDLVYDGNEVLFRLTRARDFVDVAETRNQHAVAGGLDALAEAPAMAPIVNTFSGLEPDDARAALDDLSGVDHTHGNQIGLRDAQRFRAGLTGRMPGPGGAQAPRETASLEQLAGLQLASAGQPRGLLDDSPETSRGWWVNAEGGRGDIDDTTNASGADYRFTGLT